MILCHQNPDVAASMVDWLRINPDMEVMSTPRPHVLLPHHGVTHYRKYDVEEKPTLLLSSGTKLLFYPAPFLHSPGAFVSHDTESGYLKNISCGTDLTYAGVSESFHQSEGHHLTDDMKGKKEAPPEESATKYQMKARANSCPGSRTTNNQHIEPKILEDAILQAQRIALMRDKAVQDLKAAHSKLKANEI